MLDFPSVYARTVDAVLFEITERECRGFETCFNLLSKVQVTHTHTHVTEGYNKTLNEARLQKTASIVINLD
jgi:hypothetical protein